MASFKGLSEADIALFRQAVKDVMPLNEKKTPTPQRAVPDDIFLSDSYGVPVQSETSLSFNRENIPKKRFHDLAMGKLRFEAKLDLHGLNREEARRQLLRFILEKGKHHRCVLIIHGKGGHLGEEPILKNLVNHWLKQLPDILAFHSALPKHGGNGALYVLLKQSRGSD